MPAWIVVPLAAAHVLVLVDLDKRGEGRHLVPWLAIGAPLNALAAVHAATQGRWINAVAWTTMAAVSAWFLWNRRRPRKRAAKASGKVRVAGHRLVVE